MAEFTSDWFSHNIPQHPEPKGKVPPKVGIDAFVACWQHQLVVCHKGYQLIVRKI